MSIVSFDSAGFPCNAGNWLMQARGLGKVQLLSQSSTNIDTSYHLKWFLSHCTVGPHEDIGKFPNCLNSIPNEYLGLKKENEQKIFCKYVWKKNVY